MNDIIRNETAHAINGVNGRLFTLRRPPAPWKAGTFSNQRWVSESRKVSGYGTNGQMTVQIRFDDECRNGHNDFSITADVRTNDVAVCGYLHDEIAKRFPELAHLIKWHLCGTDGPMHYIANTCYHADEHGPTHARVYYSGRIDPLGFGGEKKENSVGYHKIEKAKDAEGMPGYRVKWDEKTVKVANLEYARSSAVWPEATDEQLKLPKAQLSALLKSRLPALLAAMRTDMEAAGFLWECPAEKGE